MPRHPRVHAEGLLYHVIARGNDGQKIFLSESDYQAFIEALRTVRQRYPFSLYAYVLMSNHFHLLLEVHHFPTARILQSLLTGYVRRFNKIHHRRGHLFEGRYKAIVCDRDSYLLELVRYIHLNPVRAAMVKRPREWQWSGHGEYLGRENRGLIDSGPVMGELRTAARYEAFIRDGAKVNYRAEWHPGDGAPFLGPERFVKKIAERNNSATRLPARIAEGFTEERSGEVGTFGRDIASQGPAGKRSKCPRSIHPRSRIAAGLSRFPDCPFLNCHPSNVSRALQKN